MTSNFQKFLEFLIGLAVILNGLKELRVIVVYVHSHYLDERNFTFLSCTKNWTVCEVQCVMRIESHTGSFRKQS